MAQIKGGLFSKGGGNNGGLGFPVIEITLDQVDNDDINFTEEQFNQIMACGNFTLKFPDGTFYNFIGTNNSLQTSAFFYAIQDNQTVSPTELTILQLSIVKSTYVGTISPNTYENGGGGSQKYQHNITITGKTANSADVRLCFTIISDSATALAKSDVMTWLNDNGFTGASDGDFYPAAAMCNDSVLAQSRVLGIASYNSYFYTYYFPLWGRSQLTNTTVYDKVIAI